MGQGIRPAPQHHQPNAQFGWCVAISANTEVLTVGSPGFVNDTNTIGKVHTYEFDNRQQQWVEAGKILTGMSFDDDFGFFIDLSYSGNILAVGSPGWSFERGRVYIFQRFNSGWIHVGEPIEGIAAGDRFGSALSLSQALVMSSPLEGI